MATTALHPAAPAYPGELARDDGPRLGRSVQSSLRRALRFALRRQARLRGLERPRFGRGTLTRLALGFLLPRSLLFGQGPAEVLGREARLGVRERGAVLLRLPEIVEDLAHRPSPRLRGQA